MGAGKEYGKLTADQLKALMALLPQLDAARSDFLAEAERHPAKAAALAPNGLYWAPVYELSFEQHLGLLLKATGLDAWARSAAAAADPHQIIIEELRAEALGQTSVNPSPPEGIGLADVLGLLTSVDRSYQALLLFGRYLNELVADVRTHST